VQMDVSSVLLHRDVDPELYTKLPSVAYTNSFGEKNIGLIKN
jgi:hypothetical protein